MKKLILLLFLLFLAIQCKDAKETAYTTDEVLDDGGAYGDSGNYLFWFDTQGNYHQYYPSGGTYLEICDRPLRVKKTNFSITLN